MYTANRRMGGAGIRRGVRGGVRASTEGAVEVDFRYTIPDIQAAFYRGDSDENVTLISTDIDDITDAIPSVNKSISDAPYTLSAPTSGQRPVAVSGMGIQFAKANTEGLSGAGPASRLNASPFSYVYRVKLTDTSASYAHVCAANSSANNERAECRNQSSLEFRAQIDSGPSTYTANGGSPGTSIATVGFTYNGTTLGSLYLDGSLVDTSTFSTAAALDMFAMGFNPRSSPANFLNGTLYEVIVTLGDLSTDWHSDIHDFLASRYP